MGLVDRDDGWRMPHWLWALLAPLLPGAAAASAGVSSAAVSDRDAMEAILLVLRTGMQWNALNSTGSVRPRRRTDGSRSGSRPGVFHEIWRQRL